MNVTLLLAAALLAPVGGQTIDGIKPVYDAGPKFAQAVAKQMGDEGEGGKADLFAVAYFAMKAKMMSPLTQTKYTAAQMGICGTILKAYDPKLGSSIKEAADRISKGTKDFDSFTKDEQDAIGKAMSDPASVGYPLNPKWSAADRWQFYAGASVGGTSAYATLWHISPKQPTLLKMIQEAVQECAAKAKSAAGLRPEVAEALKGFGRFEGKALDEGAMRGIGAQVEVVLKAATPAKYRW